MSRNLYNSHKKKRTDQSISFQMFNDYHPFSSLGAIQKHVSELNLGVAQLHDLQC